MELAVTIIGLIIALVTFKLSFFRKPKEELEHLKILFKANQKLYIEVKEAMEQFIDKHNIKDETIFGGVNFIDYTNELKESYEKYLSDDLYQNLDKLKLTKPAIESMTKSLENQSESLTNLQIEIRLKDRQFSA